MTPIDPRSGDPGTRRMLRRHLLWLARLAALLAAALLAACGASQPTAPPSAPSATPHPAAGTPALSTATPRPAHSAAPAEILPPTPATSIAGPSVKVPAGQPPEIDGVLSPGEWEGARRENMAGGGELWLLQDGEYLYVGLRATRFGAGSLCAADGDEVRVLHASAALGTARYAAGDDGWRLEEDFDWCCRSTGDSAAAQQERAAHLQREGWLANISGRGTPEEMEYQIALREGRLRLAVTYMEIGETDQRLVWWPEGTGAGCRTLDLIRGPLPAELGLAPETWATVVAAPGSTGAVDGARITLLYDNTTADPRLGADWGFAALVEVPEYTVLFDTGSNGPLLLRNMEALGVDLEAIDAVVLSHEHADHVGGLPALLAAGVAPPVYAPAAFGSASRASIRRLTELVEVTGPVEIVPGVQSTGQVSGAVVEQGLVVETTDGLVVITGCAHPGATAMVSAARSLAEGEIALVVGGFHMAEYTPRQIEESIAAFQELDVRRVSPTHCTGDEAITAFAGAYGDGYLPGGVGRTFTVGSLPDGEAAAEWATSTPEEQGIDSERLAQMLRDVQAQEAAIDSILVARNGVLVLEAYRHPYGPDTRHIIHSCTKSIVSALVGIAIEQGALAAVDQPVLALFPERAVQNVDERKQSMTLEHLLTMTTGLDCRDSYLYEWEGLQAMRRSRDWVQHVLDLPMAHKPGAHFEYCNGASFLLSAILQQASGQSALAFAQANLFRPLGIEDIEWPANPQGIQIGWGELRMRPRDMAKIGQLYLQGGRWQGRQIVPAAWVAVSTRKHATGTLQPGYGYQWWVRPDGVVMALGYAGQYIAIVPERSLVVVFTSALPDDAFYLPQRLLYGSILPAVAAEGPLPAQPAAVDQLELAAEAWARP